MYNKKKTYTKILPLALASAVAMGLSQSAMAEIVLYDQDDTTFSTDGYFNTFYVHSKVDSNVDGGRYDRNQSRVKMGFLPNYIGFNFKKQLGDLKLGGRSSFWVTINDSETNGTESGIDVRQFYATVANDEWGEVLFGKDFGLFARSNILLDEMLTGYGQVSDTLGLVDGGGVSFGNIGTGYPYPFPSAQVTYRSPVMSGLRVAVGIMDPVDTSSDTSAALNKAYQDTPRFETEITYQFEAAGAQFHTWLGGMQQSSDNTDSTVDSVDSKGVSYGVQAKMGSFSVTASGFQAEGINPFYTNNAGEAQLRETDSDGYLLQGSYRFGKNRVALSYGKTEDEGNGLGGNAADFETRGIGLFHSVNDNLTLVAELNEVEVRGRKGYTLQEDTRTFAVGAALSF